uniref:SPRY domain-containing protein n=1 Tax=Meloidogyne hapla TaxID=6305 RepID=A0A1I8BIM9_MELHA
MADIPLWPAFQFDGIGAEEDFDEESDSHDEEELTCLNSCKDVQLLLTEKESSDSDFELIQSNDIIKLEKNFNNIQIDEGKMKRKINTYFENEIKSKHQKLNSDVLNEELKQTFQKMFVELKNENSKQINALKEIIEKKDEKIISLENQVKQMNDSFDKRFGELTGLKQFNRTYKNVSYVQIKNKWKYIDQVGFICCNNKCINTDKPYGVCIEGNGYVNIINDEIRYINCIEKAINKTSRVYAEYLFNRPKGYYINYSLFYFEIKVKIEEENNKNKWMVIGLSYNKDTYLTRLLAKTAQIKNEKHEEFNLGKLSFNNGDIFGCGLVYPPTKINELPYIFFTQNGKQIGKALFSKENFDWFRPYVILRCCSVIETNFGNDLEKKPFIYEITKHEILKEFY